MAAQPRIKSLNSCCPHHRPRKLTRHNPNIKPIRIDIHPPETTLSPSDEQECRQIYDKLQQLQPNGVCVTLDTLRRALYPPLAISKNRNEQILLLKSSGQRPDEMPEIRTSNTPKPTKLHRMNLEQIIAQVKKHAAINYSYYTRTK